MELKAAYSEIAELKQNLAMRDHKISQMVAKNALLAQEQVVGEGHPSASLHPESSVAEADL